MVSLRNREFPRTNVGSQQLHMCQCRTTGWTKLWFANKTIRIRAWRGIEGSRRLRLPDFRTVGT